MRVSFLRISVAAACLLWLAGCETTSENGGAVVVADAPPPATVEVTGSLPPDPNEIAPDKPEILGKDPNDSLAVARKYFEYGSYGVAERHFRKATELHPRDAEAWLGLAASYDRLRRFDLADRAYRQVLKIAGPRPEILNNQGFSYMLRGDYARARTILLAAAAKDPDSPFIRSNLELLEKTARKKKAVN